MAIFDGAIFDSAIFDAAAASGYTITITPGTITLAGQNIAVVAARNISVTPGAIALTGAAINPTVSRSISVTPSAITLTGASVSISVARSITVEPGTITLTGAEIVPVYDGSVESQPEPEPTPAEVNWPGTTIPRSQFKAMQRAALARALAEARREHEETPQPVKKATRKAARRVLRVMAADGLLSNTSLSRAEKPLAQAIAGTISFQDLVSQFDAMLQEMEARQQAIADQYEDEAIALLLLAA